MKIFFIFLCWLKIISYLCSGFYIKLRGKDTKKVAEKRILTVKNRDYVAI